MQMGLQGSRLIGWQIAIEGWMRECFAFPKSELRTRWTDGWMEEDKGGELYCMSQPLMAL